MEKRKENEAYIILKKQWDELYKLGENVSFFFRKRGIRSVIIYGSGSLAERLTCDLKELDIKVNYLQMSKQISEISFAIDIVVVLDIEHYIEIEYEICKKNLIEVISIQELIDKTLRNIKRK